MAVAGLVLSTIALVCLVTFLSPGISVDWMRVRRTGHDPGDLCRGNLHGLGKAMFNYATEHDRWFPPDVEVLVDRYVDPWDLECPSAPTDSSGFSRDCDYFLRARGRLGDIRPDAILACDYIGNHSGGRNVLHADGLVTWLSEAEFQAELAEAHNASFREGLRSAERE